MTVAATVTRDRRTRTPRPLSLDQQRLAEQYIPLARSLAGWYRKAFPTLAEDFESEALWGLTQAAGTWRLSGGASFKNHARRRIIGAVRDVLRASVPKGYRHRPDVLYRCHSDAIKIEGLAEDDELGDPTATSDVGWEVEALDELWALTGTLPPQERQALRLYFGYAGATLREVGRRMGLGEPRACQIVGEGLARLRRQAGVVVVGRIGGRE